MSFNNFNQARILTPFYDPLRSYEENYVQGPFGAFADQQIWIQTGEPEYDFFGHKVYLPFGFLPVQCLIVNIAKLLLLKGLIW